MVGEEALEADEDVKLSMLDMEDEWIKGPLISIFLFTRWVDNEDFIKYMYKIVPEHIVYYMSYDQLKSVLTLPFSDRVSLPCSFDSVRLTLLTSLF